MALTDKAIKETLMLEFKSQGINATSRDIKRAMEDIKRWEQINANSILTQRDLERQASKTARGMVKMGDVYGKTATRMQEANDLVKKGFNELTRSAVKFGGALGSLVGVGSFGAMLKSGASEVNKYSNSLVEAGAAAAKYGIGIGKLEQSLSSLSSQLTVTRAEATQLFMAYEKGIRSFSRGGFDKTLGNIRKAVGPNVKAMQAMLSTVTSIVDKAPDLQGAFENLGAGDKERIGRATSYLLLTQKISQQEYKAIRTYIAGSQQMTSVDRARQRELEKNQETFQQMEQHYESLKLLVGENIAVPFLREISDWLSENKDEVKDFFENIGEKVKEFLKWVSEFPDHIKKWGIALASFLVVLGTMPKILAGISLAMKTVGGGMGFGGGNGRGILGRAINQKGMVRGGIAGAVGFAGGAALSSYSDKLREEGDAKGAGAAQAGSGAMNVIGSAGTGAMIGSLIGPIGTGIGALVGGAVGVFSNWSSITSGIGEFFGIETEKSKKAKEEAAKSSKEAMEVIRIQKAGAKRLEEVLSKLGKGSKDAKFDADVKKAEDAGRNMALTPDNIKKSFAAQAKAQNKFNETKVGVENEQASAGVGKGVLDAQRSSLADVVAALNDLEAAKMVASGADAKELGVAIKGARERVKEEKLALKIIEDKRSKIVDNNEAHQSSTRELKLAQAANEQIAGQMQTQKQILDTIVAARQAESSLTDAIISRQQQQGKIDYGEINSQVQKTVSMMQNEKALLMDISGFTDAIKDGTIGAADAEKKLTTEYGSLAPMLKKLGVESLAQLAAEGDKTKLIAQANELVKQQAQEYEKMTHAQDANIALAQQQTSLMTNLVSLADNFAIGVGASAKMRMQAVQYMQQEIGLMKENLSQAKKALEYATQQGDQGQAITQRKRILEIENQITGKIQQQAGMVKSLQDGWISAIGAMNTGAGRFTKIMISQDKNLGAGLKAFKMVTSNRSGAVGRGGYNSSERFTGVQGQIKGAKDNIAYRTDFDVADNAAQQLAERSMRGGIKDVVGTTDSVRGALSHQTDRQAAGAAGGITAVSQPHLRGSALSGTNSEIRTLGPGGQFLDPDTKAGLKQASEAAKKIGQYVSKPLGGLGPSGKTGVPGDTGSAGGFELDRHRNVVLDSILKAITGMGSLVGDSNLMDAAMVAGIDAIAANNKIAEKLKTASSSDKKELEAYTKAGVEGESKASKPLENKHGDLTPILKKTGVDNLDAQNALAKQQSQEYGKVDSERNKLTAPVDEKMAAFNKINESLSETQAGRQGSVGSSLFAEKDRNADKMANIVAQDAMSEQGYKNTGVSGSLLDSGVYDKHFGDGKYRDRNRMQKDSLSSQKMRRNQDRMRTQEQAKVLGTASTALDGVETATHGKDESIESLKARREKARKAQLTMLSLAAKQKEGLGDKRDALKKNSERRDALAKQASGFGKSARFYEERYDKVSGINQFFGHGSADKKEGDRLRGRQKDVSAKFMDTARVGNAIKEDIAMREQTAKILEKTNERLSKEIEHIGTQIAENLTRETLLAGKKVSALKEIEGEREFEQSQRLMKAKDQAAAEDIAKSRSMSSKYDAEEAKKIESTRDSAKFFSDQAKILRQAGKGDAARIMEDKALKFRTKSAKDEGVIGLNDAGTGVGNVVSEKQALIASGRNSEAAQKEIAEITKKQDEIKKKQSIIVGDKLKEQFKEVVASQAKIEEAREAGDALGIHVYGQQRDKILESMKEQDAARIKKDMAELASLEQQKIQIQKHGKLTSSQKEKLSQLAIKEEEIIAGISGDKRKKVEMFIASKKLKALNDEAKSLEGKDGSERRLLGIQEDKNKVLSELDSRHGEGTGKMVQGEMAKQRQIDSANLAASGKNKDKYVNIQEKIEMYNKSGQEVPKHILDKSQSLLGGMSDDEAKMAKMASHYDSVKRMNTADTFRKSAAGKQLSAFESIKNNTSDAGGSSVKLASGQFGVAGNSPERKPMVGGSSTNQTIVMGPGSIQVMTKNFETAAESVSKAISISVAQHQAQHSPLIDASAGGNVVGGLESNRMIST